MTATIKTKSDRYYIMVDWRQDGKRKQKWIKTPYFVGENCKRKLEQLRLETLEQYKSKMDLIDSDMLFSDYLIHWLDNIRHSLALSKFNVYYCMIHNTIAPFFAAKKITLGDLSPDDIQAYYNNRMDEYGNIASTIVHVHAIIHHALDYAVKTRRLKYNPADAVQLPKRQKRTANFYTVDELKTLLECVKGDPLEPVVLLASWFGMRRGEILGLRWDCVDFDKRILSVVGVLRDKAEPSEGKKVYYYPAPKTSSSIRSFPMPQVAVDYLQSLKAAQDARRADNKYYNHAWDGFVCVHENGDIIDPHYASDHFPRLCKRAGLRQLKLHELRHTNISLLIEGGATIPEVSAWAGHSSPSITANVYAHTPLQSKFKLTSLIDDLLSSGKE